MCNCQRRNRISWTGICGKYLNLEMYLRRETLVTLRTPVSILPAVEHKLSKGISNKQTKGNWKKSNDWEVTLVYITWL